MCVCVFRTNTEIDNLECFLWHTRNLKLSSSVSEMSKGQSALRPGFKAQFFLCAYISLVLFLMFLTDR